jgi:hypothetical protein
MNYVYQTVYAKCAIIMSWMLQSSTNNPLCSHNKYVPTNLLLKHVYIFTYLDARITTALTKFQLKIMLSLYRYDSICGSGDVASFMSATNDVSDQLHSPAALLTRK